MENVNTWHWIRSLTAKVLLCNMSALLLWPNPQDFYISAVDCVFVDMSEVSHLWNGNECDDLNPQPNAISSD